MFLCSDEFFVVQKGKGGGSSNLLALPAAIRTRKRVRAFMNLSQSSWAIILCGGGTRLVPARYCFQALFLPRLRVRIRANLSQNIRASAGRSPSSTRASSKRRWEAYRLKAKAPSPNE